jgi:HD-GYP domain-containing protein (c-di-GMP phosphodiesterase class II)
MFLRLTTYELKKSIATRLLAAWALLSIVLGIGSYYFESKQIDAFVFSLAAQAAKHFNNPENEAAFLGNLDQHRSVVERFLKDSRFAGIRLFGRNKKLELETWKTDENRLLSRIEKHRHTFPNEGDSHYNKIIDGGNLYVQIVIPLSSSDKKIYGYFEGIYEVDSITVAKLEQRIITSLLIVVLVIGITSLVLYPIILSLNREATNLSDELLQSNLELLQSLGSAIAKRDSDTDAHNYRVTLYAIRLAKTMGRSNADIESLIVGAFLHDVGKIGIADQILLNPGKLTHDEIEIMKTHVIHGKEIIQHSNWLKCAHDVVLFHHERFDGTGYPQGLMGKNIPINARLFAVVDVFDALTSKRPYKDSLSFSESMNILHAGSGSLFDPEILVVFERIAPFLYEEFCHADLNYLQRVLKDSLTKYFYQNNKKNITKGYSK